MALFDLSHFICIGFIKSIIYLIIYWFIVIELLNGHTVVHKSVCDVSTGQVMIDDYYNDPNFIENGDSALVLSGNAMRLLSKSNKKSEGENSTTTTLASVPLVELNAFVNLTCLSKSKFNSGD